MHIWDDVQRQYQLRKSSHSKTAAFGKRRLKTFTLPQNHKVHITPSFERALLWPVLETSDID